MFCGIYEFDTEILKDYIKDIKYQTATDRMVQFKIPRSVGGSILYGYTWRGKMSETKTREWCPILKRYKTKLHSERPDLLDVFKTFRDFHFPDFEFNGIQMNKNYKIGRHIDKANIGESVLVCCGDYTGGLTCVEYEDKIIKYDASKEPVRFDGGRYYHYVEDFSGDRYSLVFFNDKKNKN